MATATRPTPIPDDVHRAVGELLLACEPHLHNERVAGLHAALSEMRSIWDDVRPDAGIDESEQQKSEAGSPRLAGALERLSKAQADVRPDAHDLLGRQQQADQSRLAQGEYLAQASPAGFAAWQAAHAA